MRLTPDEALQLGLITPETAQEMKKAARSPRGKRSTAPAPELPAALRARIDQALKAQGLPTEPPPTAPAKPRKSNGLDPQRILFDALCQRMPGIPQWEVEGLVPDRKFRADIFIPPSLVVEMDGFGFHRSKEAFQKDRMRQNLFTAHGYRTIRAFAAQIFDETRLAELVDLIEQSATHAPAKP